MVSPCIFAVVLSNEFERVRLTGWLGGDML
ncbi:uncharacterized protein METZ01_LOCUS181317 [marine metagenome]|uniref:Uncharacterized protein n=1 Tax=marine metagenome TaxID=408172 RepID=A0A382CT25_9ZZZZ